ncbi:MAG: hypothetical protein ABFS21_05195 [Actinomycetota bacterium]
MRGSRVALFIAALTIGVLLTACSGGAAECEVRAVPLLGAWVGAGAPNGEFDFTATDDTACRGDFESDVLPLFTEADAWFDGSQSCTACHYAISEDSYHEMDLTTYEGVMAGADALEDPPGVSLFGESAPGAGDFDWGHSKMRARLRNNRMPPGWTFDITEENRDGPTLSVNGTEVRAVDLLSEWTAAGVPETEPFGSYGATFTENVLPLFTEANTWFNGSQPCSACHYAISEDSYHEMDLTSYEGILAGADALEDPPGVSLFGESAPGAGDFDWGHSKMRERMRNNRMPPGWTFDITEENRDGPTVLAGSEK